LYVYNEITYDRFHTRHDRIYRLLENEMEYTKGLTLPYLTENFPRLKDAGNAGDVKGKMENSSP
ncbi:MAG: hypothetical protein KFF73_07890, partial [Cyclobacteriaceae bacterium]|nr:hypothetical protein [Cyclobacteriaceae bacterium]